MPVCVKLLTGSSKARERKEILKLCGDGSLQILIGTHAVIEDHVVFKNLGFAVIDEQHKFGVAQRARLWKKNSIPPHILVMTATPIPRTLALTAYGDLDYSVIDELPPGRQPVVTLQRSESTRHKVMDFVKEEIAKGRQAYIVYPLIEESSKVDYENLMKGYEEVKSFFAKRRKLFFLRRYKLTTITISWVTTVLNGQRNASWPRPSHTGMCIPISTCAITAKAITSNTISSYTPEVISTRLPCVMTGWIRYRLRTKNF